MDAVREKLLELEKQYNEINEKLTDEEVVHMNNYCVETSKVTGKKYKKITCSEKCRKEYVEMHKEEINKKRSNSLKHSFSLKTKDEIKIEHDKARQTCLERYGKENYAQTENGRKISSENMKKMKHVWDEKYKNEVILFKISL